jgi:hypothetical protein
MEWKPDEKMGEMLRKDSRCQGLKYEQMGSYYGPLILFKWLNMNLIKVKYNYCLCFFQI